MSKLNSYQKWGDVVKGIGILAVVIGHYGGLAIDYYIYWFHMPLFFIMSGYFFKPIEQRDQFPMLLKKNTYRLLVPYFSFLVSITIIRYGFRILEGRMNASWLSQDIVRLLLGGRFIGGWYAPIWFITTLFLTYIAFNFILLLFKKDTTRILLIGILYLLAHLESWLNLSYTIIVPLNLDVTLLSLSYFAFGYYAKKTLSSVPKPFFLTCSLITVVVYTGIFLGYYNYTFGMKGLNYHNILLDFVVPTAISVTIIGLSQIVSKYRVTNILAYLGKNSLAIMFIHMLPNVFLHPILGYGVITYTIIGITVPLLITHFMLDRFQLTKTLFLGKGSPAPSLVDTTIYDI